MFETLFDALAKTRDDLRNRAGFVNYLADFAEICVALIPLLGLLSGGREAGTPAADLPPAGAGFNLSPAALADAHHNPLSHDDLANRLDGLVKQRGQAPADSAAAANHPYLKALLAQLGPLLAQLFLKAVTRA